MFRLVKRRLRTNILYNDQNLTLTNLTIFDRKVKHFCSITIEVAKAKVTVENRTDWSQVMTMFPLMDKQFVLYNSIPMTDVNLNVTDYFDDKTTMVESNVDLKMIFERFSFQKQRKIFGSTYKTDDYPIRLSIVQHHLDFLKHK